MKTRFRSYLLCLGAVFAIGCTLAEVKVDVLSERTTLENQILGTYNSLDTEMLLAASVRGVDSKGNIRKPPKHSREHRDAVTAMQILAFHDDDLQAFKTLGWAGENTNGLITPFQLDKTATSGQLGDFANRYSEDEFNAVIKQINEARNAIMRRVIDMNENMSEENLPEIKRIFGKLNIENALPGEKIQLENGNWTKKQ